MSEPQDKISRKRVCVVVLNYRTPVLVADVLRTLDGQLDGDRACAVVIDNHSADGSEEKIRSFIEEANFVSWARVVGAGSNDGFSAGMNAGMRSTDAEYYVLLNSDTLVRPGAIAQILQDMEAHPDVGIGSPRLEWPDGTPQVSCFRDPSITSEFVSAASTGPITRLFQRRVVALRVSDAAIDIEWTSFACVVVRRGVIEQIGLMDEGYFMYFEDADYCRRAREAGFRVRHFPTSRVVHLRGGSSDVKSKQANRKRPPEYYYAARNRYFRKHYGLSGAVLANLGWTGGRGVHLLREVLLGAEPVSCEREWLDKWHGLFDFKS